MKEKIFSALKAKIVDKNGKTSISDKTINAYVDVIGAAIGEDETKVADELEKYVPVLQEIQLNINHAAAEAVKNAAPKREKPTEAQASPKPETEEAPQWQKAIEELTQNVSAVSDMVKGIRAEKTQTTRLDTLKAKLGDAPAPYREKILKDFGRMSFKDEEDFSSYLEDTERDKAEAIQTFANQGFQEVKPPEKGDGSPEAGDSSSIVSQIEQGTKELING